MNRTGVFISVCIPAYKRPENLERLLQSVAAQTFTDYEIVISDDSPDNSVQDVMERFSQLPIRYFRNEKPLGTPANWNYAIEKTSGEWIKMMHDDDWFSSPESLGEFAKHADEKVPFIFCAYSNVFASGSVQTMTFPSTWQQRIIKNPVTLLARNVIGPPSVTLVHHSVKERYDTFMKWRVDMDYYIRLLKNFGVFIAIEKQLVHVGISDTQVTNDCINVPEVELPEGLLLLNKYGVTALRNILVYDAWWRIIRNVNVRNLDQLQGYTPHGKWPPVIQKMVRHQSRIPSGLLKIGVLSKTFMTISYIFNRPYLKD